MTDDVLVARARALAVRPVPQHTRGSEMLIAAVDEIRLAIPLASVREVLAGGSSSRLPDAMRSSGLVGIRNVRGELLPVADAGAVTGRLGAPEPSRAWTVVLDGDDQPFGLLVDAVEGIRTMPAPEFDGAAGAARRDAVLGIVDGISVLDADAASRTLWTAPQTTRRSPEPDGGESPREETDATKCP